MFLEAVSLQRMLRIYPELSISIIRFRSYGNDSKAKPCFIGVQDITFMKRQDFSLKVEQTLMPLMEMDTNHLLLHPIEI